VLLPVDRFTLVRLVHASPHPMLPPSRRHDLYLPATGRAVTGIRTSEASGCPTSFFLTDVASNGALYGAGLDAAGDFSIAGLFDSNSTVTWVKSYATYKWDYRSQLNMGSRTISGTWGSGGTYGSFDVTKH